MNHAEDIGKYADPPKPGHRYPALRCPACADYLFTVTESLRITEGRIVVRCRRCRKETELSKRGVRLIQ